MGGVRGKGNSKDNTHRLWHELLGACWCHVLRQSTLRRNRFTGKDRPCQICGVWSGIQMDMACRSFKRPRSRKRVWAGGSTGEGIHVAGPCPSPWECIE